jgi:hypothetical protein
MVSRTSFFFEAACTQNPACCTRAGAAAGWRRDTTLLDSVRLDRPRPAVERDMAAMVCERRRRARELWTNGSAVSRFEIKWKRDS